MHKINISNMSLLLKNLSALQSRTITESLCEFNFNSEEEITKNLLGRVMLIGLNLPDTKNLLTETALKQLSDYIKEFERDDNFSSAVLHGSGGNFCSGIVRSNETAVLGQNLIKELHTLKKPIIGALNGYTTDFGLNLAIMCDMRVVDDTCIVGFGDKADKLEILPFMYKRLILNIGPARTTELICTQRMWEAKECKEIGFSNRLVTSGCALGQALVLAQSMAFHSSLKKIVEYKSQILSVLNTKV